MIGVINMRVLLTGGGTGGHIYPALAICRHLEKQYEEIKLMYVGTSQGLEAQIIPRENIPFKAIESGGISRKALLKNFSSLFKVTKGIVQSYRIMKKFSPNVVIGTGGYVCGPVVLVASLMGIPTLIHEQNAFPGVTNRLLASRADRICLTFPESEKYFAKYKEKVRLTGLPVRPQIFGVDKRQALSELGLDPHKKTLLVVGGSQGAISINRAMAKVIEHFLNSSKLQILMVTGKSNYDKFIDELAKEGLTISTGGNIIIKPYIDEMQYGLAAADLAIGRAGATFLSEITAIGLPAILIPYPYASENHQEYNAQALVTTGGAVMILDEKLNGELLIREVERLISNPDDLARMSLASKELGRPQAVDSIAKIIQELLKTKR